MQTMHVFFNEDGTGLIQVMEGKSKAAQRVLPMTPRVYELLWGRYESSGRPSEGWIFPSSSGCGHFIGDSAKDQHKKALTDPGVKPFVPYTLRHTALTNLAEKAGGDVFVLARIAGRSSITVKTLYPSTGRRYRPSVCCIAGGHKIGHNQMRCTPLVRQFSWAHLP